MKKLLRLTLGLGMLATLALGGSPAHAVSAAGPYYAPPSWDQTLPAATRFIVLTNMNSEAVLDRETGLVWEQSPSTAPGIWFNASIYCLQLNKGGRKGWRLPTIQDLASLIDPTVASPGPTLPAGHPFSNVQSSLYWSATTDASNSALAQVVFFVNGDVLVGRNKNNPGFFAWCVRGGPGVDPQ